MVVWPFSRLPVILLLLGLGLGSAQTIVQQQDAYRAAAGNYLKVCEDGLEKLRSGGPVPDAWEGKSCTDLVPNMPDYNVRRPTITGSVIQVKPDTDKGYVVTVSATLNQKATSYTLFKPHPPMLRYWRDYLLALLGFELGGLGLIVMLAYSDAGVPFPDDWPLAAIALTAVALCGLRAFYHRKAGHPEALWQSFGVAWLGTHLPFWLIIKDNDYARIGFEFNYWQALQLFLPLLWLALLAYVWRRKINAARIPK